MSWTYTNDPSEVPLDAVRLEIGDTDTNDQLLSDEEIEHIMTQATGHFYVAARCCDLIALKLAKDADRSLGPLSVRLSQRSERYGVLAGKLRRRAATGAEPYFGGLSESERTVDVDDSDLVQPIFKKGMMDNK